MWVKYSFFVESEKSLTVSINLSFLLNLLYPKNRSSSLQNDGLVVIVFITVHIVKNEPFEVVLPF